jgi:hypothetical protein
MGDAPAQRIVPGSQGREAPVGFNASFDRSLFAKHPFGEEVSNGRGKHCSNGQENHATPPPGGIHTRELNEKIRNVRGTVRNVGQNCEDENPQGQVDRKLRPRARPGQDKMQRDHEGKSTVVNEPTWLPVVKAVGGESTEPSQEPDTGGQRLWLYLNPLFHYHSSSLAVEHSLELRAPDALQQCARQLQAVVGRPSLNLPMMQARAKSFQVA